MKAVELRADYPVVVAPRTRPVAFYVIFFTAGMPALMYQVAWQRVLTLYFGVDIYSTAITVATFMLGLGLGSLLGGYIADRVRAPRTYYAAIEGTLGLVGFASIPVFSGIGERLAGGSLATVILVDFALLLLPTTLMGMTLPLMCRIVVARADHIGRHLSWLYSVNTFGAAAGALLSSYLLIGLLGLDGATYVAASLNLVLAVVMSILAMRSAREPADGMSVSRAARSPEWIDRQRDASALTYPWVLALSFLSGFTALGYEIVWYRILGLILHGTVYVFGTILFFFLSGIAFGSMLARRRIDQGRCLDRFAACQLAIGAYSFVLFILIGHFSWLPPLRYLIGASFFTTFHPSPELVAGNVDIYSLYSLLDIGFWTCLILGPPAVLMGYGFTNLIREGTRRMETLGHAVGGLYCANIVGSTLGSLVVGFVLVHYAGSEHTLRTLIVLGCAIPVLIFLASGRAARLEWPDATPPVSRMRLLVSLSVIVFAVVLFPGRTTILRAVHFASSNAVDFVGAEDRTGVSVLRRQRDVIAFDQEKAILGEMRLYIDGSHHGDAAATTAADWGIEVALAAHPAPRRVLSIGLGDGLMVATAVKSPEVQELVIVELNGTLSRVLRQTTQGETVLASSKTRYVVDDGRRWLLANKGEKFDVIMMYPLHAAHAYSGSLFSRDFLSILASHLESGGILAVRTVDLYSTARTVATVFPHVFRLDSSVYIASGEPIHFDLMRLPGSPEEVSSRITADRATILAHTGDARLNTDLRPNSEYYVTYPFVHTLQTRARDQAVYRSADDHYVRELMSPRAPE